MKLVTWLAVSQKREMGLKPLSLIEEFIFDNEPSDQGQREDKKWREQLSVALDELAGVLKR